jgi:hypothetical protein
VKVKALNVLNDKASSCSLETYAEWFNPLEEEWE